MKATATQYEKLEEELKLLRSRAFSMATPRVDSGRRRADSFASATSAQSAMSEDGDEELQKRAKEALQRVQRLEPEVVQRVDQSGLKKLVNIVSTSSSRISSTCDWNFG